MWGEEELALERITKQGLLIIKTVNGRALS
jgi:hypothetical protein